MRPGLVWGIPPGYRDGFEIVDIGLCSTGVSLGGHRILMKLWLLGSVQGNGEGCLALPWQPYFIPGKGRKLPHRLPGSTAIVEVCWSRRRTKPHSQLYIQLLRVKNTSTKIKEQGGKDRAETLSAFTCKGSDPFRSHTVLLDLRIRFY